MISRLPTTRYSQSLVSLAILITATLAISACNSEQDVERNSGNSNYAPVSKAASHEQSASKEPNEKTAANGSQTSTAQPPALSTDQIDTTEVPEGSVKELLAFVEKLSKQPPQGATEKEAIANLTKTQATINEAATKLLTMETTEEEREQAIEAKLRSLAIMGRFGIENIEEELLAFAETLTKEKNATFAFLGKKILFGTKINNIQTGTDKKFAEFAEESRQLLAGNKDDEDIFLICQQAALALANVGQDNLSNDLFQDIGNTFKTSEKPELAREAENILQQTIFFDLKIEEKITALVEEKEGAAEALLEAVQKLLALDSVGQAAFRNIYDIATRCEANDKVDLAREIYRKIGERFKSHSDKQLAETIAQVVARGETRTTLVGKPYEITGVTIDGSDIDWKQYKGKVVLVDFWATWCIPCIQELPNVIDQYKKYHEQGFEVVGVNLDDDPARLKRFMDEAPIPWKTVVTVNEKTHGFDAPIAAKNGIDKIPFTILVDREGTVSAINLRGAELQTSLAKIFDSGEKPDAEKPAAKSPDKKDQSSHKPLGAKTIDQVAVVECGDDNAATQTDENEEKQTDETPAVEETASNPYLAAPGLSAFDLVDYILDMQEKPKSIRRRPGFSDAVSEAADRVLASTKSDKLQVIAILGKCAILHERASLGDKKADTKLVAFLQTIKEDKREKVAQEVQFLLIERKLIEVDELPLEQVTALLAEVKQYLANQKLNGRHLRLASSIVHAINRLEDDKQREGYFTDFGAIFSKSLDKQLAQYGKKLSRKPSQSSSDLVGKPLELTGTTALGTEFDWKQYRGKVVLVDFWATWCAPCRREMPHVKALYEKYKAKGFDIVAVSLDRDLDALAQYLKENNIAWTNLAGKQTQELAKKYGVRGIPTMMLIDQTGKIIDVSHNVAKLAPQVEPLLNGKKPGKADKSD